MRLLNNTSYSAPKKSQAQTKSPIARDNSDPNEVKIVKKERPSELSRSEIRNMVEANKREKEEAYKVTLQSKQSKAVAKTEVAKAEVKKVETKSEVEITPEGEAFGDIKKNDPEDPNTKEKLKGVLTAGGFNFSEKEREVLGKILNN